MNAQNRTGATMYILASILLIALLTTLFSDAIDRQRNPNRDPDSSAARDGAVTISLKRNRAGHYVVSGQVNHTDAEFLLDTGATAVAVSEGFARRAGLERGTPMQAVTANGITRAYATTINTLRIAGIEEHDVAASIVPNLPNDQILLGMSFLKRLEFSQRDDTLTLVQPAR